MSETRWKFQRDAEAARMRFPCARCSLIKRIRPGNNGVCAKCLSNERRRIKPGDVVTKEEIERRREYHRNYYRTSQKRKEYLREYRSRPDVVEKQRQYQRNLPNEAARKRQREYQRKYNFDYSRTEEAKRKRREYKLRHADKKRGQISELQWSAIGNAIEKANESK